MTYVRCILVAVYTTSEELLIFFYLLIKIISTIFSQKSKKLRLKQIVHFKT